MMTSKIKGYVSSNPLFAEAFTHKSYSKSEANFERLEFLGDALINVFVSKKLYIRFPEASEGDLSRWKAAIVSQKTLALISNNLGLLDHLRMSESSRENLLVSERIQASIFESCLGAYFLTYGWDNFVLEAGEIFEDYISRAEILFKEQDPKTVLQEKIQHRLKITPTYKLIEKTGPDHEPTFKVGLYYENEFVVSGEGASLKAAEREAAERGLDMEET